MISQKDNSHKEFDIAPWQSENRSFPPRRSQNDVPALFENKMEEKPANRRLRSVIERFQIEMVCSFVTPSTPHPNPSTPARNRAGESTPPPPAANVHRRFRIAPSHSSRDSLAAPTRS